MSHLATYAYLVLLEPSKDCKIWLVTFVSHPECNSWPNELGPLRSLCARGSHAELRNDKAHDWVEYYDVLMFVLERFNHKSSIE